MQKRKKIIYWISALIFIFLAIFLCWKYVFLPKINPSSVEKKRLFQQMKNLPVKSVKTPEEKQKLYNDMKSL